MPNLDAERLALFPMVGASYHLVKTLSVIMQETVSLEQI